MITTVRNKDDLDSGTKFKDSNNLMCILYNFIKYDVTIFQTYNKPVIYMKSIIKSYLICL